MVLDNHSMWSHSGLLRPKKTMSLHKASRVMSVQTTLFVWSRLLHPALQCKVTYGNAVFWRHHSLAFKGRATVQPPSTRIKTFPAEGQDVHRLISDVLSLRRLICSLVVMCRSPQIDAIVYSVLSNLLCYYDRCVCREILDVILRDSTPALWWSRSLL